MIFFGVFVVYPVLSEEMSFEMFSHMVPINEKKKKSKKKKKV